ncbi:MAG: putative glycosyl transferase protein [Parcubacteria group bacterium Gr01-1014_56]|nr:MAG: putative glycosyl transferase protein [Parcubacteria group bacterium Gr01-1014_56]
MLKLTVAIPAYKEEENLKVILPRLVSVLERIEPSHEILIIDTREPMDATEAVCADFSTVHYIPREGVYNYYGDAIRTAVAKTEGEYLIFMDADGSHDPEFITQLYAYKDDFDVVIASRYVKGGSTKNSKVLVLMSLMVNIVYALVLNLNCKDVSNSFKLYKAKDIKSITLTSNNFEIVEEILFKIKKKNRNLKIKEVPFTFDKRMFGETKRNLFVFMVTYLYTLFKLRFGK